MTGYTSNFSDIDRLFHPRGVAIVGASKKNNNQGKMFLDAMNNPRFKGDLYVIHPTEKVKGFKSYHNLMDVPGPVDHAILSVPAAVTADVISDCGKKGVRSAALFTSGFAEEGTAEGIEMQNRLVETARKGGVRLIGPNCMGLYCPSTGLNFRHDFPMREGHIGFIAQSGGICMTGIFIADNKRLGFSKAISYGNESDLGGEELLAYLADDPETEVILLYVEGVRDGAKFLKALKYANSKKPVVMLKGGITSTGTKAASSHTGAIAGSSEMWKAAAKQAGVPIVPSMDELFDAAQVFSRLEKPAGKRLGLITISGGFGVFATDVLAEAGLEMPYFTPKTAQILTDLIKRPGTSVKNPVDMATTFFQLKKYPEIFNSLDADENVDFFVALLAIEYLTYLEEELHGWAFVFVDHLIKAFKEMKKPVAVVFFHTILNDKRLELEKKFMDAGFPVFPTVERCAHALVRRIDGGK